MFFEQSVQNVSTWGCVGTFFSAVKDAVQRVCHNIHRAFLEYKPSPPMPFECYAGMDPFSIDKLARDTLRSYGMIMERYAELETTQIKGVVKLFHLTNMTAEGEFSYQIRIRDDIKGVSIECQTSIEDSLMNDVLYLLVASIYMNRRQFYYTFCQYTKKSIIDSMNYTYLL
jgi:hypothetical protein